MGVVSGNVWPAFVAFRGQGERNFFLSLLFSFFSFSFFFPEPISWDEEVPVTGFHFFSFFL